MSRSTSGDVGIGFFDGPSGNVQFLVASGLNVPPTNFTHIAAVLAGSPSDIDAPLPLGWIANNDGTINSRTTQGFPPPSVTFDTYNAGDGADRTLATGNDDSAGQNQLQFSARIIGSTDVRAVRLGFYVEAWAGNLNATSPGEAAYVVDLEVDRTGSGDFGRIFAFNDGAKITTGLTLAPGLLNGNSDVNRTMFDSGLVELQEALPAGSDIRLTFDAQNVGQTQGYLFGLDDVMFRVVAPGDSDGNGEGDSNDLFNILEPGKFNYPELGPATWREGDYNGDDLLNSAGLFLILSTGKFNQGPYSSSLAAAAVSAVPEPSTFALAAAALFGLLAVARRQRKQVG